MNEGKNQAEKQIAGAIHATPPSARASLKNREITPADYVHLHNHTNHSVLDGLTKIPELIDVVKNFGMNSVAMTDHGTLSGWIEFYKTAREENVKPILGMEAYIAARDHTDRDPAKDKARYHLTILAKNNRGMHNLMKLSTIANLEGVYYKPRIDHKLLEKYREGLIVLSGCASGEIGENLKIGNYEKAKEIAAWYRSVFGENYFMEVQDHGHPDAPKHWEVQNQINRGVLQIAAELDIPAVVTCDAHYARINDSDVHEILLCVGTGSYLSDKNRMSLADFHLHVTDPREIIARWGAEYPDVILNAGAIAAACAVDFELGRILIPTFDCPDGENEKTWLEKLVYRGLAWRYGAAPPDNELSVAAAKKVLPKKILERTDYEMGVIDRMGYDGYFLIVQDFINWGKNQGIIFGPGRGSAAGSIVSYALRITELDPMKYDLLFERFLNPDRVSMPDIDIDIQDTRRDEVIEYCTQKYGEARVANIATFGTMASRGAVKDVARVLEVPYAESDRLSKLIPPPQQGHQQPLAESVKTDPDLKQEYETNPTSKKVIDYAMRLEGTIRSHGVHAAGVVIAPDDLVKFAPLEMAQKGVVSTQFPKDPIEELGLLKMDFLGLSNLTIINNAMRIIRKVYGEKIVLESLPMDDKKTFELLQKGETTGVFQLESAGMKRYLRELKPTHFDDIIAMVALYRPGPMQFIDSFIRRKHGEEEITYLHPKMQAALESTYGIMVYQEQFMQISKDLAGFSGGQADTLRKAVGKKKIDLMRKVKKDFIDGAQSFGGASKEIAETFWNELEEFANYCFNKSHAACYGLIAYWTAYLKAHFPAAFMAALMTSDANNTDRLAIEIAECSRLGIKVLNPDINESFPEFAVVPETGNIRFGLSAVKAVGVTAVDEIMRQREIEKFSSVEDFARRANARVCNKKVWESLIKTGAFDSFAEAITPENADDPGIRGDRSDLMFNIENIIAFAQKVQKEAASGQADLFDMLGAEAEIAGTKTKLELPPAPTKISGREQLTWERDLLGLYLSGHPLQKYELFLSENAVSASDLKSDDDGAKVTIGGLISDIRTILTKNGGKMAFLKIEDRSGEIEVIVFPKLFSEIGELLTLDKIVQIEGTISGTERDGAKMAEPKVIADKILTINEEMAENYQATGQKMTIGQKKPARKARNFGAKNANFANFSANNSQTNPAKMPREKFNPANYQPIENPAPQKIYVLVKDPSDGAKLLALKDKLREFPGKNDVILVLGEDKKDALKLPFQAENNEQLLAAIGEIYGADCVAAK